MSKKRWTSEQEILDAIDRTHADQRRLSQYGTVMDQHADIFMEKANDDKIR